jgi:tetratricopeptide (TPR) repeat protein
MGNVKPRFLSFSTAVSLASLFLVLWLVGCASAPSDPVVPFLQEGEAALAEGDANRAVAAYQVALSLAPGDPRPLRGLLKAQIALGDGEGALEALEWLEAVDPVPVDPCPALALAIAGRTSRGAAPAAEELARRDTEEGCPGARERLGSVLGMRAAEDRAAGRANAAVERYREAIALDPEDAALFVAGALLLIEEDRVVESVELLSEGLELHPDHRALRDLMVRALTIR